MTTIKQRMGDLFAPGESTGGTSFLPADYLQKKVETRANIVCLLLFGVVLFGVVGAFLVTHRAWSTVREQQRGINAQYTEQTKKIEQLKQLESQQTVMLDKAEIAATLNERVPRSILMAELVNRMPERVTLTEMQLTSKRLVEAPKPTPAGAKQAPKSIASKDGKGGAAPKEEPPRPKPQKIEYTLSLIGYSNNDEAVADYQRALKECGLLTKVDLVSAAEAKLQEVSMRKFRIEAMIRPDADARKIEPLKTPRLGGPLPPTNPAGTGGSGGPGGSGGLTGPGPGALSGAEDPSKNGR